MVAMHRDCGCMGANYPAHPRHAAAALQESVRKLSMQFPPGQRADARPCAAWSPGAATPAASVRVAAAAALRLLPAHPSPPGCRSDTAVY